MSYASDRLREFHEAFEVEVPSRDSSGEMFRTANSRLTMHEEEHAELKEALEAIFDLRVAVKPGRVRQEKLEAIAEELSDEMILLYGDADVLGIDLDVAFRLKMDANFAKLPVCRNCKGHPGVHWPGGPCTICAGTGKGKPIKRESDGKIERPEGWQEPSMAEAIK